MPNPCGAEITKTRFASAAPPPLASSLAPTMRGLLQARRQTRAMAGKTKSDRNKIAATAKRTIRGEKYNIENLIDEAITHGRRRRTDTTVADAVYLRRQGHTAPTAELVNRVGAT